MSDSGRAVNATVIALCLLPVLALTACLSTRHGKGKPSHSESGQDGTTNWFGTSVTPEVKTAETNAPPAPPDNTAQNKREAEGDTLTPWDQGSGKADRRITQDLRKSIVLGPGPGFSFLARNIKIITVNNVTTLRGVVETEQEKQRIEALAKQTPGVKQVNNQLQVVQR